MMAVHHQRIKTVTELHTLLGPFPKGKELCQQLFDLYTIYEIPFSVNGQYYWDHYDIDQTSCNDLLLSIPTNPTTACSNSVIIVANGKYTKRKPYVDCGITHVLYTKDHSMTILEAIATATVRDTIKNKVSISERPYVCSTPITSLNFEHDTFKVLCKAFFNSRSASKYIEHEAKRLYNQVRSWPILYKLYTLLSSSKMTWTLNKKNGSITADVFDVLKVFPHLVAKRYGIINAGIITLQPSNTMEHLYSSIVSYMHMFIASPKFTGIMEIIYKGQRGHDNQIQILQSHEREYIYDILKHEKDKQQNMLKHVCQKHSEAPPCVHGIINEWKEKWNYKIRFHLAGILRSVAATWDIDALTLAEPFIVHMRTSNMPKESIGHFIASCKSPRTADIVPCNRRRLPYSISPHEFWCPFGGCVELCLRQRTFAKGVHLSEDDATPSLIWSLSQSIKPIKD